MIKLHRRNSRIWGSFIDLEKMEQLKRSKIEIEEKVTKVLNEHQEKVDGNPEDSSKVTELVALIGDLHKQYQSLYAVYDNLKGQSRSSFRIRKDKEAGLSYSSSDSEYYSPDEAELRNESMQNLLVAELKQELASANEEKESRNMEYKQALDKIQEANEKEKELSALLDTHKDIGSKAEAKIKELEGQLTQLNIELESMHNKKRKLESQVESQADVAQTLQEENFKLQTRVMELVLASGDVDDVVSLDSLTSKENNSTSKTSEIVAQFTNLQQELVSLRLQKGDLEKRMECIKDEASDQVKELTNQINAMQQELQSLHMQNTESQLQVESKTKEISENLMQIETLKEELAKVEKRMVEEREDLVVKIKDLEMEADSLLSQRNEASDQVKKLTDQINSMQQELQSLHIQNTESQLQLESKTKEISENLMQIEALKEELAKVERGMVEEKEDPVVKIKDLEMEADSLVNQRNELEQQIRSKVHETTQLRDEKEELHARVFELEGLLTAREKDLSALQKKSESSEKPVASQSLISLNISKFNKIADQTRISKVSDDSMKVDPGTKLESSKSLSIQNIAKINQILKEPDESLKKLTKVTPQTVEKKMEELAAGFRKYIEDKIRLLSRRIRVLEQLHAENREFYRSTHETLENENKMLLAKVTCYEDKLGKVRILYETAKTTMKKFEYMANKLEEGNTKLDRVSNIFNDLQLAKNCIQKKGENIRKLGYNLDTLNAQLEKKKEEELLLKENIGKLEEKLEEKDEELLCLGEEKREAIRQLCLLMDHHLNQNQHLKEMIFKLLKGKKTKARH